MWDEEVGSSSIGYQSQNLSLAMCLMRSIEVLFLWVVFGILHRTKGPTGSHLPDLPSLDAPASNMVMAPVAFNRCPPEKSSMKRSYQEVMPTETALPYCNIDTSLSFNLASEMFVRVDPVKRLILNRNTANDQVQFFL